MSLAGFGPDTCIDCGTVTAGLRPCLYLRHVACDCCPVCNPQSGLASPYAQATMGGLPDTLTACPDCDGLRCKGECQ